MIGSIKENDLLTLDDDNKYFIIQTIEDFDKKVHLLIRYLEDKEEFDYDDIAFVEEVNEDGEIYLDPITSPDKLKLLASYTLTTDLIKTVPGFDEELEKTLNEIAQKGSQN